MTEWPRHPRVPLGEPYWGVCRCGESEFQPDSETVRECCNFGNVRARCARFPATAEYDTISLTAWSGGDGAVEVQYIMERDHTPVSHGRLQFSGGDFEKNKAPDAVLSQARAFAESYLRSKRTPQT
jgi:hypothetical protein